MTNKEVAKHVFARNPKLNELFITSDQRAFYEEHQADSHAQRLKARKVVKIVRDQLDKEVDVTPKASDDTITNTAAAVGGAPKETNSDDGGQGETGDQEKKLEEMGFDELQEVAANEEVDLDEIKGQLSKAKLIEAIGKKRAESQELDFDKMALEELVAYAKDTFDLDLKPEATKEELIELINDHIKAIEVDSDKQ